MGYVTSTRKRRRGFSKTASSRNGIRLVPCYGSVENVRSWKPAVCSSLIPPTIDSWLGEERPLVRPFYNLSFLHRSLMSLTSSAIIQHILSPSLGGRASVAYFYFDFRDVDKKHLHNILPSLLFQFAAHSSPCCDLLSRVYSAHKDG